MECPHHIEPRSIEIHIVQELNVNHEELHDDIVWINANKK